MLARADRQDLEVVKKDGRFPTRGLEFQIAVNRRWRIVGSKTRGEIGREERITLMKEALDSLIPTVLLNLIGEYF